MKELQSGVNALDKETAFMTAVMEQAEITMSKVGEQAESQAAKIAQLETRFKNLTNTMKVSVADAAEPLIDAQLEAFEASDKVARAIQLGLVPATVAYTRRAAEWKVEQYDINRLLAEFDNRVEEATGADQLFNNIMARTTHEAQRANVTLEELAQSERELSYTTKETTEAGRELVEAQREQAEAAAELDRKLSGFFSSALDAERGTNLLDIAISDIGTSYHRVSGLTDDQRSSLDELTSARDRALDRVRSLQSGTAGLGLSEDELTEAISKQNEEIAALESRMAPLASVTGEVVAVTRSWGFDLDAVNTALFEQAESMGLTMEQLAPLGVALGQYTEEQGEAAVKTAIVRLRLEELVEMYAEGKISAEEAAAAARHLTQDIDNIPTRKDIEIQININRNVNTITRGLDSLDQGGAGEGFERQHGGSVVGGRSYLVGEAGPEIFRAPFGGGNIIPNNQITNNLGGITINTSAATGTGIADEIMVELGRRLRGGRASGVGVAGQAFR